MKFTIYDVGYSFKVQTVFKTNKHKNFEYFEQFFYPRSEAFIAANIF